MTITPDSLRRLADGIANQNSHAERIAARYAASADMLDALRGLANALEMEPGPRGVMDLVPGAIEKARAAIAKAERAEP